MQNTNINKKLKKLIPQMSKIKMMNQLKEGSQELTKIKRESKKIRKFTYFLYQTNRKLAKPPLTFCIQWEREVLGKSGRSSISVRTKSSP